MKRHDEIVLVEDNEDDVAIALRAFRKRGIEGTVTVLRDGEEALHYFQNDVGIDGERPKAILLDLKLPKVDGWEVLREIRSNDRIREVPVVVVSSSDREADVRESYRLGANSFVLKRFGSGRAGEYLAEVADYWLRLNHTLH